MNLKFFLLFVCFLFSSHLNANPKCNLNAAHNSAAYQACGIQPTIAPAPTSRPNPVQTPRPIATPIPTPHPTRTTIPRPTNTATPTPAPTVTSVTPSSSTFSGQNTLPVPDRHRAIPTPLKSVATPVQMVPTPPQIAVPTKMPYSVPSLVPTLPVTVTPTPPQMAVPTKMPYNVPHLVPTQPVTATPTPPQMAVPTKLPYAVPSLAPSQLQGSGKNKNGSSIKQIKDPIDNQQSSPEAENLHRGQHPRPTVTFPMKDINKEGSNQIDPQGQTSTSGSSNSIDNEIVTPDGVDKSGLPSNDNEATRNSKKKPFIPILGIEEPIHSVWLILLLLAGLGLLLWHKKSR